MSPARWLSLALAVSVVMNGWLLYQGRVDERRDQAALARQAGLVTYWLSSFAEFADLPDAEWEKPERRRRLYQAWERIVQNAAGAGGIPVEGDAARVRQHLHTIMDWFWTEGAPAEIAFTTGPVPKEAKARVIAIAQRLRDAGFVFEESPESPAGWSVEQGWPKLLRVYDRLMESVQENGGWL